ncbi:universal stress protein [Planctomicrobium piriforme]|uniref:Nucleotide-binding universal stress protein, UspA family n=1 Tax=Planctomicrobium piriforme TaxID=1576369 RepID=A0A1I3T893_9PLAN|nr:universal stress protein [Planctomicrobium piriforme]SFJ65727.1 Nucleotide-binding universal stress protein, UspA family [Planctomicrobium piriforme]
MPAFSHEVVVVPVDFSKESENALRVAVELTGDVRKLRLLHVMTPLDAISPAAVWGEFSETARQSAVRDFAKEFLSAQGVGDAVFDLRYGNHGLEITDYAKEQKADLIIVSSHGYHGLKRLLLGSVAEAILRHAHCAVLVLRRQDAE